MVHSESYALETTLMRKADERLLQLQYVTRTQSGFNVKWRAMLVSHEVDDHKPLDS